MGLGEVALPTQVVGVTRALSVEVRRQKRLFLLQNQGLPSFPANHCQSEGKCINKLV